MKILDKVKEKLNYNKKWDKYYGKGKNKIKVPNLSLYEFMNESSLNYINNYAINYFGKRMTYREFFYEIDKCAKALRSHGIRPGDVVSICMANTPEAIISFYAVNKIGAISNMIHPLSAEEEIKDSLNATNSVMLILINVAYDRVKNIIDETNVYKTVIVSAMDSMPSFTGLGYFLLEDRKVKIPKNDGEFIQWSEFIKKGENSNAKVLVKTTKNQPAVILHSGGTTGTPKNIVLNNGNINVVIEQVRIGLPDLDETDKMLTILPLFHCFGLVECVHYPLCSGAEIILIPKFDASRFDKLLTKYKPTIVPGVPTLFEALINNKHMKKVDLSFIKYIVSGGDTMNAEKNKLLNDFLAEHNCNTELKQGYGMTETSGGCIFGVLGTAKLGSVGIPLPGNEVKIMDINSDQEMKDGEIGEIYITGPSVMTGYLDNIKETNEILQKDKAGKIWVKTGDLGYLDKDGLLYYVQRLKRMLIVSGYNVYPSHIEEVLNKHEYILSCGVVGIPHPYKVQVPKAYIVLKEDVKASHKVKKEIKEYCKKNLAHYMLPKEFVFKESLPKTKLGKVDYRELEKDK
ncbi:MAG: AMP-binding protein [Bacilli bacterium]|nr:AMP-binding protein [Bacilli bacterium]